MRYIEFTILVEAPDDVDEGDELAQKIQHAIRAPGLDCEGMIIGLHELHPETIGPDVVRFNRLRANGNITHASKFAIRGHR
jgi:hypothetical protein